ncbi:MAG: tRNA (adenosine(37)-N6)-threonylcarbamoyltransferase complex dimerization subunit type 1 TsaB [Candidatus Marinimicrobia bacterium]|nr:tRNA (adenosine(37)-N6)-threonylcarbamoyltransferase complex dimerization subunit type 1 TsaB [Candidatus Neomarinimicrobiota bacterium]
MNLLAIETATTICGVAYFENGKCVSSVENNIPRAHAETLPLYFQQLARKIDLNLDELDGIAVSIGPGSFTGLRIGLSYAKGLAYSHSLPIVPVPTLHSLAVGSKSEKNVTILLHSHSDIFFHQKFLWESPELVSMQHPVAGSLEKLLESVDKSSKIFYFGGDKHLSLFKHHDVQSAIPSVKWIGALAETYFQEWKEDDPKRLVPEYISPFKTHTKAIR